MPWRLVLEGMLGHTTGRGIEVDSKEAMELGCGNKLCLVLLNNNER